MTLTNEAIYNYATLLQSCFLSNSNQIRYIKAKVNFYLQKNISLLVDLAVEIEKSRDQILTEYGERQENGSWKIREECIHLANQELKSLMSLKQSVKLYPLFLSEISDLDFTPQEMKSLLFMIKDDLINQEG